MSFDLAPDGRTVVFTAADGLLYLLDVPSRRVRPISSTNTPGGAPAFFPDGKTVVYSAYRKWRNGSDLYRCAIGGTPQPLTDEKGVNDTSASVAPNGSRVVFSRAHRLRPYSMGGYIWDDYDLYTMKTDGSDLRRITREVYRAAGTPRFLPDGKTILFWADSPYPESKRYLFTVPADGHAPPQRFAPPANAGKWFSWGSDPAIASRTRQIAFISDRGVPYEYDVWTMRLDGSQARPLNVTGVSTYNQDPVFTPNGKQILWVARTQVSPDVASLWRMNADGSNPQQIAGPDLFDHPRRFK